jgi:1,3-beta-glucanosyltransferase GAS1
MDAYKPTNSPAACPAIGASWAAASSLPPTPDTELCECMFNSISCAPSSGLDVKDYGDIFGYICGADPQACAGVNGNASTGVFGAYSMCNSTQKLGYVLDTYYKAQKSASDACDFNGKAVTQSGGSPSGDCKSKLASASSANAVAATATAGSGSSGSSSGSGSSSSSSLATPIHMKSFFSIGDMAVGLWAVMAMGAGAAVFAL